ncbi:hypothetical protein M3Y96_01051600 [Aphelenchoides besseyi]|nr:hypothetical protein M3Y96_01051600 [Aphelenchoides besseyi]
MNFNTNVIQSLFQEEYRRTNHVIEIPLASKIKGGGEAVLQFPVGLKQVPKTGTAFALPAGTKICCVSNDRYKIEAPLNDRVYVVRSHRTHRLYAMKIEWLSRERSSKKLLVCFSSEDECYGFQREVFLMSDLENLPDRYKRHLPRLINKGRVTKHFNFIIYTLCNYNLHDIRMNILKGCDFSKADAARLSIQTFQAIHDLHHAGYLHRTISPTKFCIGINKNHYVYLIGFSRSYHFEQRYSAKSATSPRVLSKLAKRTFLPRNYHRGREYQRKDDLESWVYLCFNIFGRRLLPWNDSFNDASMLVHKERLFANGFEECYKYIPRQFNAVMNNLDKELPTSRPDYVFIAMTLMTMRESIKFHLRGDFDFQRKNGEKNISFGEKEEEAMLFIPDAKDEVEIRAPIGMITKKRGGFKDDEADDTEDQADDRLPVVSPMIQKPVAPAANPIRYSGQMAIKKPNNRYETRPISSTPPPNYNLMFNGNKILQGPSSSISPANPNLSKPVDPLQAEKNQLQRQKMELQMKLAAAKMGQSKDELEMMRRERDDLVAKLAALEAGKEDQGRLEQERKEKEELEQKLKAIEAEQEQARLEQERKEKEKLAAKLEDLKNNNTKEALEKERREKAELKAKIAELEAQKKRDAEAAKASSTPSPSPQPSPSPIKPTGEKLAIQSTYADDHLFFPLVSVD